MKFEWFGTKDDFDSSTGEGGVAVLEKLESSSEVTHKPQEDVLRSREVVSAKKIGVGITDSSFIELKDDGKAVFKTENYKEERAAYLVDLFLDLGLVPPTVIRTFEKKKFLIGTTRETGSAQEFVPDTVGYYQLDENSKREIEEDMMKMWIFDVITDNDDRHPGNFLVKDKSVIAIDHGFCFGSRRAGFENCLNLHRGNKNLSDYAGKQLPLELVEKIRLFLDRSSQYKVFEELLSEVLGSKTAEIVLKRINAIGKLIIDTNGSTIGWPSVIHFHQ